MARCLLEGSQSLLSKVCTSHILTYLIILNNFRPTKAIILESAAIFMFMLYLQLTMKELLAFLGGRFFLYTIQTLPFPCRCLFLIPFSCFRDHNGNSFPSDVRCHLAAFQLALSTNICSCCLSNPLYCLVIYRVCKFLFFPTYKEAERLKMCFSKIIT